jgi:excisionase family DNA binding protein
MKSVLEPEDIQAIADAVAARLHLVMPANASGNTEEENFDVPALAAYLKVDKSWVYKQVQLKTIPHFHVGRYPRFKKSTIDKWTRENATPAVGSMYQPGKLNRAA